MGTVPTGVEEAAREEISAKLRPAAVHSTMGKVFMETAAPLEEVTALRAVDRLFLLALHHPSPNYPAEDSLVAAFKAWVVSETIDWPAILDVWQKAYHAHLRPPEVAPASGFGYYPDTPCRRWDSRYAYANSGISFAVSCTRTGLRTKSLTSKQIAQHCGDSLVEEFGWKVDLEQPALSIAIYATDDHFIVGIPLLESQVAKREHIRGKGLRCSIAYAMCRAAGVANGSVILDPMCGRGTTLLEGAVDWPDAHYIGGDLDDTTLEYARINAERLRESSLPGLSLSLFKWDATRLPLRDRSVDVVVSDVPYGKRHGSKEDNRRLYPHLLEEFARVLRPGGRVVLLTTLTRIMEGAFATHKSRWTTLPRRALINNGGLNTYLFVATRKEDPRDGGDDDGLSNRERKRRRARAWHAAQALEAATATATAAEPSSG